jgi:RNA polymerase sigma factor (TIGR02999 family)
VEDPLQTTALVHEAYLRLVGQDRVNARSRAHFFGIAAQAMRRILVDHARNRLARKRGAGLRTVELDQALGAGPRGLRDDGARRRQVGPGKPGAEAAVFPAPQPPRVLLG